MTASRHKLFYQFLGAHSLLIGLFPFFIPVWLWKEGYSLAHLCLFVAITGLSFCLSLRAWENACVRYRLKTILFVTFILEILVVATALTFGNTGGFLVIFAIINGAYNCFFWTTQRTMFLRIVDQQTSGRQYGNFQIFVMVFLKIGIFSGGLLLEHAGLGGVFALSALATVALVFFFHFQSGNAPSPKKTEGKNILAERLLDQNYQRVSPRQIFTFRDGLGSRPVFIIDGLFLFFESHLWTLSLFLLSDQNFANLGFIVIILAVVFSLLFLVTKNTIDRVIGRHIFVAAVALYSLGWFLRVFLDADFANHFANQWLLAVLLIVTFCTSFFRLAFNKQFFDIAKQHSEKSSADIQYLVIKSYLTQATVVVLFSLLAFVAVVLEDVQTALSVFYATGTLIAFVYLYYRPASLVQDAT